MTTISSPPQGNKYRCGFRLRFALFLRGWDKELGNEHLNSQNFQMVRNPQVEKTWKLETGLGDARHRLWNCIMKVAEEAKGSCRPTTQTERTHGVTNMRQVTSDYKACEWLCGKDRLWGLSGREL